VIDHNNGEVVSESPVDNDVRVKIRKRRDSGIEDSRD
jgi:hypothetical protein